MSNKFDNNYPDNSITVCEHPYDNEPHAACVPSRPCSSTSRAGTGGAMTRPSASTRSSTDCSLR